MTKIDMILISRVENKKLKYTYIKMNNTLIHCLKYVRTKYILYVRVN